MTHAKMAYSGMMPLPSLSFKTMAAWCCIAAAGVFGTRERLQICLGVAMQNDGSLAVYNVEANRAFGPVLALCLWVAEAT